MITRSDSERRRLAEESRSRLRPALGREAQQCLDPDAAVAFLARLDLWFLDVHGPLAALYGEAAGRGRLVDRAAAAGAAGRGRAAGGAARGLDRRREVDQAWYQSTAMIGYVAYVDRFAGSLAKLPDRLDHLAELGVTLPAPDAVARAAGGRQRRRLRGARPPGGRPAAGHHGRAVRAGRRAARAGHEPVHRPGAQPHRPRAPVGPRLAGRRPASTPASTRRSRTGRCPTRYEADDQRRVPASRRPGSFSWVPEADGGPAAGCGPRSSTTSGTSNYTNPRVFAAMLETVLWLANRGVEIFRMDAVPFMWQAAGHQLPQPARGAPAACRPCTRWSSSPRPATVFKAEAIVAPDELVAYLGGHARYRPECELAYHNQLMVMLWSSLATKDARLATQSLRRLRPIPAETSWATYVRCHDDIGWAVSDVDARAVGYDPFAHRDFLNAFYSGQFPMSFARGALFGENPATGDARISGSAAALCGISDGAGPRRRARAGAGHPPAGAAARGDLRLGRGAAALHGRRAGPGQRRELPAPTRRWPGTTGGCTGPLRRRRGRPPARPGHRRGAGVRLAGARWAPPARSCRRCTRRPRRRCSTSARRTCWAGGGGIRAAAGSSGWPTSPSTR